MSNISKRQVEIAIVSDTHLGTYGCHASELLAYLESIDTQTLILNGDIIDVWQFSKRYWPKAHMKVVRHLLKMISKGTEIYYIPGNHDETMRRFVGFELLGLKIENKVVLELSNGEKAWIFHGDVFDVSMKHSKWLAKLGGKGYDMLILLNSLVNWVSEKIFNKGKISLSKKIKNSVKTAVKYINDFEQIAAGIGISNKYDYVVCGHIHQPQIKTISNDEGSIQYLNSGDWIENLTSLEFNNGCWELYHHAQQSTCIPNTEHEPQNAELFDELVREFELMKAI